MHADTPVESRLTLRQGKIIKLKKLMFDIYLQWRQHGLITSLRMARLPNSLLDRVFSDETPKNTKVATELGG